MNIVRRNLLPPHSLLTKHAVKTRSFSQTLSVMQSRRRFLPLRDQGRGSGDSDALVLKGIVFDMDGTLYGQEGEPQNYMFAEMRSSVGIPKGEDILDYIHALPEQQQKEAFQKIQAIESEAMSKQVPQAGLISLMEYLDKHHLPKAICTRNFDAPVNHLLEKHLPGHLNPFSPIITREFRPPKPSPAGILHIAKAWGIIGEEDIQDGKPVSKKPLPLIMVGDSIDDMVAGHDAGAATVLLRSKGKEELETDPHTDLVIDRLDELITILDDGFKGRET